MLIVCFERGLRSAGLRSAHLSLLSAGAGGEGMGWACAHQRSALQVREVTKESSTAMLGKSRHRNRKESEDAKRQDKLRPVPICGQASSEWLGAELCNSVWDFIGQVGIMWVLKRMIMMDRGMARAVITILKHFHHVLLGIFLVFSNSSAWNKNTHLEVSVQFWT